jgi:hypothetical protein
MDLDEQLARYIATQDGVTDWDMQPPSYQEDVKLYAQAAIRFFMDQRSTSLPSELVVRLRLPGLRPDDPRVNDLIRVIDRWEAESGIDGSSVEVVRPGAD